MASDNTPIIVGVGQFVELADAPDYRALSPVDLAAEAARRAFADALPLEQLAPLVDTIASTRTFNDSAPQLAMPFGASNNFPRSIGKRLGIEPQRAIWADAGGNTPQDLVNEMAEALAAGSTQVALLVGAEAISTGRYLMAENKQVDWKETIDGSVEDRLGESGQLIEDAQNRHGLRGAPPTYAVCENARRRNLGLSRADYAQQMGTLFAPFSAIAAANPYSTTRKAYSAEQLVTPSERNRTIAAPYTRLLVSRDQVNLSAAVVMTTVGKARALGIPEALWVYLHGYAKATEKLLMQRADLGRSPAAHAASKAALESAGIGAQDVRFFDLYSCFPIAVSNVCDGLGIAVDDPRGLTVTGGLPYFGGPGNNYSMHGIASIVERLRAEPGSFGFVGANGGLLSKYSVGVYSTRPADFKVCNSKALQQALDAAPSPAVTDRPNGSGTIETYTILYGKDGQPASAVVIGRLPDDTRFMAASDDAATLQGMVANDPLDAAVTVTAGDKANRFALA